MLKTFSKSKHNLFSSGVIQWKSIHNNIRKIETFSTFIKLLKIKNPKFIRLTPKSIFNCKNYRIKVITRLRLGLTHLRERKFKYRCKETLNPICSWLIDVKMTTLLSRVQRWNTYPPVQYKIIDCRLLEMTENVFIKVILLGNCFADACRYRQILSGAIKYMLTSQRFDKSRFHS